ncbi:protein jagged-1-like isoform X2 [Haliotis rufescens]|uniref:protein jagged-1-like isoform X2 n=1 Tax=Haliotis rufescens TaxID=6454 RepID=UPI00201F7E9B|nr:protein jagged-1-like isoform X2 [Haliotis rufescens]
MKTICRCWPGNSLGAIFVFCLLLMSQVKTDGKLDIRFISYWSDGRVHSGYCCEEWFSSTCYDACDPIFSVCVDDPRDGKPRALYRGITAGMHTGSNDVVFGSSIQGTPNPFIIQVHKAMPSVITVKVVVADDDLQSEDDYMDTLTTSANISASANRLKSSYAPYQLHGRTSLKIEVRAYCDPYWYGSACETHCRNTINDHYMCNFTNGDRMCLEGWKGGNCDEDIDECSQTADLCQHGGNCTNTPGSFECRCMEGFTGRYCELVTNHCALNKCLNGGTCNGNETHFSCTCPLRWSGETCAEEINLCDSTPCDRGNCTSKPETSARFKCDCEFPWTGETCDQIVDITNITLRGVIDRNNRDNLTRGLTIVINNLGKIQGRVNVVASTSICGRSISSDIVTNVQFYVTMGNGTFLTSDFVREIFSSNSDADINQRLPLPLYPARDADELETDITNQKNITWGIWFRSSWYKVVAPLATGVVLVALCVAFYIYRRKANAWWELVEENEGYISFEMGVFNGSMESLHKSTRLSQDDDRVSTGKN